MFFILSVFTKFSIKLFCENYCAGRLLYITYYFSIRYTPPQKQQQTNKQTNKQNKNTGEARASIWETVINLHKVEASIDSERVASTRALTT